MDLKNLSVKQVHQGLLHGEFTALELTQRHFEAIKKKDGEIKAFISLMEAEACRAAEEVDLLLAKGGSLSLLAGVPLAIKDNILIQGIKTTAASKSLENYRASFDAAVIKKLKEQKAVFLGKTNLDEFAMGSSTENSAFQITRNPFDLERVAGGSSGGTAAAVAVGEAVAGLGSDTGGSIRQPAAFCGVVGLKPTYGAVSRHGLIAMASSLDQIGPIAKTVEDAALVFAAIKGKDFYDATTVEYGFSPEGMPLNGIKDLKIGLPREYFQSGLSDEMAAGVEQAIGSFKKLGAKFKEVSLPHTKYALPCYYIIMPAEVSTNLARYDGVRYSRFKGEIKSLSDLYLKTRSAGFGAEVKRRVVLGTFVLSSGYYDAYYAKAQKVRNLIRQDFQNAFKEVDVILTPTTPTPPFKVGEKIKDPLAMYLSDIYTVPANLAGIPALSIPVRDYKTQSGLPAAFQLMGNYRSEDKILSLGMRYDKLFGF